MKTITLILAIFCITATQAQYKIDNKNSPANPVPFEYTLNHKHLQGKVKERKKMTSFVGFTETYNDKGQLTAIKNDFSNQKFTYDGSGKLLTIVLDGSNGTVKTNALGYITEISYQDGSGSKYGYNDKNLFAKELDLKNTLIKTYTYDSQNRVVKLEELSQDGSVSNFTTYQYETDGNFLKITNTYKNYRTNPLQTFFYDQNGNRFLAKPLKIAYDAQGNPTNDYSGTSKFECTYYQNGQKEANAETKCTRGDCTNGFGDYNYDDGSYFGFFENGKCHGFGIYKWNTGKSYNGEWNRDIQEGFGNLTFKDGSQQIGYYKNGKLNGVGIMISSSRESTYGIFSDGILTTVYGNEATNSGKGCITGDCTNKYGRFNYDNGGIFLGFFKNGYMQQGTWYAANGDIYVGQFGANNQFEGYGNYVFKNKDSYFGTYKNGKRDGKGVFYYAATGVIQGGEWKDDQIVKEYKY